MKLFDHLDPNKIAEKRRKSSVFTGDELVLLARALEMLTSFETDVIRYGGDNWAVLEDVKMLAEKVSKMISWNNETKGES